MDTGKGWGDLSNEQRARILWGTQGDAEMERLLDVYAGAIAGSDVGGVFYDGDVARVRERLRAFAAALRGAHPTPAGEPSVDVHSLLDRVIRIERQIRGLERVDPWTEEGGVIISHEGTARPTPPEGLDSHIAGKPDREHRQYCTRCHACLADYNDAPDIAAFFSEGKLVGPPLFTACGARATEAAPAQPDEVDGPRIRIMRTLDGRYLDYRKREWVLAEKPPVSGRTP